MHNTKPVEVCDTQTISIDQSTDKVLGKSNFYTKLDEYYTELEKFKKLERGSKLVDKQRDKLDLLLNELEELIGVDL